MKIDRKEAIRLYKERKPQRGVYSFTSNKTGAIWVDSTPNLDKVQSSLEFVLRHGEHRNLVLQSAWNEDPNFTFTVLEKFDETIESPLAISELLKGRRKHWAVQLGAPTIYP